MKWFKLGWFTSKEREELKKAEKPVIEVVAEEVPKKPYKNIFYSNRNLTVILQSGTMLSKANAPVELLNRVESADSEDTIKQLLVDVSEPKTVQTGIETKEEREVVSKNLDVLRDHPDFVVKGQDVFLKGVNLAMPAPVIASFIELLEKLAFEFGNEDSDKLYWSLENQIDALKMFWLKLALNPLPQSREDLLVFARKNDIRITRNGNLILYRRIVTKEGADTQFVTFVTQNYYRIKKEGFDTRQFAIARQGDGYSLIDLNEYDGTGDVPFVNLQVAYLELPTYETNTFTSAHDRNVEIKLGGVYSIPEDKINLNNSICAAGGLHAAAVDYNYSGFGDMPVVVLVNPSKAITVPMGETGKLRTTEMFIACVNDKPLGTHFDEDALAAFDSEYHDVALSQLEEAARNKSFEALSVQNEVPAVSLVDLNTIKEMLKNRVRQVF
jgi:hypothetical protein